MTIGINSNGASKAAQREVAQSSDSLTRVFERLSSGQRINRASDDAAGLAIADTLSAKSRVFTAGVRNISDGVSLLSIADQAVASLTDITIRQKELAEQAANGVYSSQQRIALDKEAQALSTEFTRIAQTTSFNGLKIFNGDTQGVRLQAGMGVDGSIFSRLGGGMGTESFTSQALTYGGYSTELVTADLNGDGILDLISNDQYGSIATFTGRGDGTFDDRVDITGIYASVHLSLGDFNGDGKVDLGVSTSGGLSAVFGNGDGTFGSVISISGDSITAIASGDFDGDGKTELASINSAGTAKIWTLDGSSTFTLRGSVAVGSGSSSLGVYDLNGDGRKDLVTANNGSDTLAVFLGQTNGSFTAGPVLTAGDGPSSITAVDVNGDGKLDIIQADDNSAGVGGVFLGNGDGTFKARYTLLGPSHLDMLVTGDFNGDGYVDLVSSSAGLFFAGKGDGTFSTAKTTNALLGGGTGLVAGDFNGDTVLDYANVSSSNFRICLAVVKDGISSQNAFSLKSAYEAKQAFRIFDDGLKALSSTRANIGAFQSRLSTASSVLVSSTENFKAAESRIRSSDVAKESADLARLQILQRTGIAVLGQANLQPQIALRLLRD